MPVSQFPQFRIGEVECAEVQVVFRCDFGYLGYRGFLASASVHRRGYPSTGHVRRLLPFQSRCSCTGRHRLHFAVPIVFNRAAPVPFHLFECRVQSNLKAEARQVEVVASFESRVYIDRTVCIDCIGDVEWQYHFFGFRFLR